MSSISLSSVCLKVQRTANHGIDVSPAGAIALFSGRVCTVLLDVGPSIEPYRGFEPFPSEISCISWCKGCDENCRTPLHLFISDEKGHGMVFDIVNNKPFVEFNVKEGFITAVEWDRFSASNIVIGTSTGRVSMLRVGEKTAESLWSVNFTFRIDILNISPFDPRQVVVASKDGHFSLATSGATDNTSGMLLKQRQLVNLYFHPNFDNVLVMVQPREVRLFFNGSKETLGYHGRQNDHEDIVAAFFPDSAKEEAIVIVYRSHAVFLAPDETQQNMKLLTPLKGGASNVVAVACNQNKLYFMASDNSLVVYELKGKVYWATKVVRNVATKPKHFTSIDSTLAFGCKNGIFMTSGYCDRVNTCSMKLLLKICASDLDQIVAVDPNRFILTAFGSERQRVFFVDIARREVTSLLKSSLELLAQWPVKISTSISREYVAIIVANTTTCFYALDDTGCHLIKTIFLGPGPNFGTFSENSREFWLINGKLTAEKYVIDPDSPEIVRKKSTVILAKASQIGVPTTCICSHNKLIVGTESGSVAILSWNESPLVAGVNERAVKDVVLSPDHQCCYVRDVKGQMAWINIETLDVVKSDLRFDDLKFANSNELITRSGYVLNLCNSSNLSQATPSCGSVFEEFETLKHESETRQNFIKAIAESLTPDQFGSICRLYGYVILGSLIECVKEDNIIPECLYANLPVKRLKEHLDHVIGYLNSPTDTSMGQLRLRSVLIEKEFEEAFKMLLATPSDAPEFSLNILKASLIDNSGGRSLAPSVAALVGGGKSDDAIDVLLLIGAGKEAARLLVAEDHIEMGLQLVKYQLEESECEAILPAIEKALVSSNRAVAAAGVYMALRRFHDAARVLRDCGLVFAADVIDALSFDNGTFTCELYSH